MLKGNLEGNKDVHVQSNLRKKQHSVIQRGATFSFDVCTVSCFLYFHCIHNINSSILLSQER